LIRSLKKRWGKWVISRLRVLGIEARAFIGCRAFSFAKYRIDSRHPVRYIERNLRRKLRRNFETAPN
jgi:hypothetical protein